MRFSISKFTVIILAIGVLASCNSKKKEVPAFDKSYTAYVNSFTSGVISKKSSIRIGLTQRVSSQPKEDVLSFSPKVEGELIWIDDKTIEFVPAEDLKPGEVYVGELSLNKFMKVPDSLKAFEFGFQIIHTNFEWGNIQLKAEPENQMKWYSLEGNLLSADKEDLEDIANLIEAEVSSRNLKPDWSNNGLHSFSFKLDSIERIEDAQEILLKVNTSLKGTKDLKDKKLEMPALGDFRFMGFDLLRSPSRVIVLKFSDPIKVGQNLKGLITLEDVVDLKYKIDNTTIQIFPPDQLFGKKKLQIFKGIQNILGYKFEEEKELEIEFKNEKPQLRFLGNGNILPNSENLLLPFEAISLKAADVKVVKISEHNMLQFLQNNQLDGSSELHRVGEIVAEKKIDLETGNEGLGTDWRTYSLDLSELIEPELGAVYRVYMTFKKEYSTYICVENLEKEVDSDEEYEYGYYEYDYYDYGHRGSFNWDDYYYSYPRGYSWKERDNPCHASYYISDRFITRNILASDLGVIVKKGNDNKIDFTVSDLKTAKSISGVVLNLYNYQQRLVAAVNTNDKGWATYTGTESVYFVKAEKDKQRAYLKLDNAMALSVSNFKVQGNKVDKGLKGFIYGERGVWRPGDSIHLNFILEDGLGTLPEDHPVHFELISPSNLVVDRQISNSAKNFIRNFSTYTKPTDETGNYQAKVRVGDIVYTKRIKVETVKPNRLDIDLHFKDKTLLVENGKANLEMEVKWLTGVEAANSKTTITANIASVGMPFKKYSDYHFNDPSKRFSADQVEFFEGKMNSIGQADITGNFGSLSSAPGMLKARFLVKAFEGGGDFSTEYFDADVSPFKNYVGLKVPRPTSGYYLKTDKDHILQLRTLTHEGKSVDINGLEVKVYKISRSWWYNSSRNSLANYINNESTYLVQQGKVNTVNGVGQYKLKIKYPSWGRFLVRVTDGKGHSTGQVIYVDWPEDKKEGRSELQGESLLNFTADKDEYNVGDEVIAKIPVAENSRILMTIENGTGILKKEWVEAKGKEVEYKFTVTPEMAPNVYISAFLMQPHAQTLNDRPIRLYGIVPISVKDPETELSPIITSKDVWRPETEVSIKVKEEKGKSMYYTLAVVDEGLLNLTQFKTPKPWPHFYAKEALGVRSWDIYNQVIGAYGGELTQVYALGGDEALSKKGLNNQNRFKPMVRHLGPFELKAGKEAEHKITLPNYVGKVRVMVVAANKKKAYGSVEKSIAVRKPLMVLSTLPRVVSPKEKITLPVTVFAMEDKVREVEVSVEVEGKIKIIGESKKKVSFSRNGEKVIDFQLETPEQIGNAIVKVKVKGAGESAYDNTELMVRLPNPPVTYSSEVFLKAGQDTVISYVPVGVETTNRLTVESYGIPPINLEKRLKYLTGYPHGCTEQTISRVFPLLYLESVMDLTDDFKEVNNTNLRIAIQHLYERQVSSGGFRYWPNKRDANLWVSSYAGQFLYHADKKGYNVPAGMISRWEKFQKNTARSWKPRYYMGRCTNCFDQSYRLYTLAEIGKPEIGAMNRLKEANNIGEMTHWNLAGAYLLAGQKEVGRELAFEVMRNLSNSQTRYANYGSGLRNDAMKLEVLALLGEEGEAFKMARMVSKKLTSTSWYSTHGVSYGLKTMLKVYGDNPKTQKMAWAVTSSSGEKETYADARSIERYRFKKGRDETLELNLKNTGTGPLNFSVVQSGIPIEHDVPAFSKNLTLSVDYMYPNGDFIDVNQIKQGQDFMVDVTVYKASGTLGCDDMALSQLFPSGWEIINTRLVGMGEVDKDLSQPTYQDIRDDRVYSYFNLSNRNKVKFRIRLNATYAGKYFLPPVYVEDMYNADTKAQDEGQWVEVVR